MPVLNSKLTYEKLATAVRVLQSTQKLGHVHTCPESFESATFSFRIQKFPRPRVAYSWRADSKISGFAAEFAGCVWTEAVSGKKKLRIQKYPDTCVIFHVVVLQRTAKNCTQIYNARAQPLFCSLNLLLGDVLVAVGVVVCLRSLMVYSTNRAA